ncbi:hypothetical protein V9T40_000790 [Parthenolecanium corni]|uniref:Uncharacterized protein n=1 Tax=Parthenolecanium corni TaxID=536013 RepID=A0AAN9TBN2_9HEMI
MPSNPPNAIELTQIANMIRNGVKETTYQVPSRSVSFSLFGIGKMMKLLLGMAAKYKNDFNMFVMQGSLISCCGLVEAVDPPLGCVLEGAAVLVAFLRKKAYVHWTGVYRRYGGTRGCQLSPSEVAGSAHFALGP